MMALRDHGKGKWGFTLMEMIISITVLATISALLYPIISIAGKTLVLVGDLDSSIKEGSIAMHRMSRELIEAERTGLTISPSDEISFQYDGNTMRYYLDGTNLTIDMNGSTGVLAEGITNLQFSYDTADPNTLNYVRIALTATDGDAILPLRTTVYPRDF
ncbi:MAG: prepilin-type N-terminal cleavage/methylation domain-containing protein [Magnetococcales bacterium]|nr:prepilin-type N-terminal cleavage/methylation domain-containing protein [Magnetococcales bacterium]